MNRLGTGYRFLLLGGLLLASDWAAGDSWVPPRTEVTLSANGQFRVTVIPRPLSGPLAYFEDKVEGAEPAGQREGEAQASPIARVEQLESADTWRFVWQRPLVNDVAPVDVLLANDASFLITFDNWHSVGYGDDVVVIYDRNGNLANKFSLDQILPAAYVHHLPRSVSSRWWGGEHRLVDGDSHVELQVLQAGDRLGTEKGYVPVRIRLTDGEVLLPSGAAWERVLADATTLEEQRLAAWEKLRELRATPLGSPDSPDTHRWRRYMFELRDRIASEEEVMGGMVLAAPGEEPGFHDADDISGWIEHYAEDKRWARRSFILASPTSDRLADLLATTLLAQADGAMMDAHLVFVGTLEEGERVIQAARGSAARVTVVDRTAPFPPGVPLPKSPPPLWEPMPAHF